MEDRSVEALEPSGPGAQVVTNGDPASFEATFRAEYPGLVRLATVVCGEAGRAEEVVQDAFAVAYPRWTELDRPGAFLQRCVVNGAIDATRRRKRSREDPLDDVDPMAADPDVGDRSIWAAIDGLPGPQRAAVALRFYADLPLAEIAEVLERPLNTVKSDLRRALAALSKEIDR